MNQHLIINKKKNISISDELRKLKLLKEEDLITSNEYNSYKGKLMSGAATELVVDEFRKLKSQFDSGEIKKWEYRQYKALLLGF